MIGRRDIDVESERGGQGVVHERDEVPSRASRSNENLLPLIAERNLLAEAGIAAMVIAPKTTAIPSRRTSVLTNASECAARLQHRCGRLAPPISSSWTIQGSSQIRYDDSLLMNS